MPSQWAHDWAPLFLPLVARGNASREATKRSWTWRGLTFRNPLGIAGGVDKTGQSLKSWQTLGAGFLEVGTVTPLPQKANPGRIMARALDEWSLWNKMGFPNGGALEAQKNLGPFLKEKKVPLFVNIGKNRDTPNGSAHLDYVRCMEQLWKFADAFVINISSPNTQSLRALQTEAYLKDFLEPLLECRERLSPQLPLLLKMSPDMDLESLQSLLSTSAPLVDGWILTNTTQSREYTKSFPKEGGVSGAPLTALSRNILKQALDILGTQRQDKLVVSVGGILDVGEVQERLKLGADLVQTYSGLVFHGPQFFFRILKGL